MRDRRAVVLAVNAASVLLCYALISIFYGVGVPELVTVESSDGWYVAAAIILWLGAVIYAGFTFRRLLRSYGGSAFWVMNIVWFVSAAAIGLLLIDYAHRIGGSYLFSWDFGIWSILLPFAVIAGQFVFFLAEAIIYSFFYYREE